jgi:ABC-type sugar transport system ATPase subunit
VSSNEVRAASSTLDEAALKANERPGVVLEVKGLVKEYPGTRALDGVDIEIRQGEIHALLGENGAGKSTLIRSICGASQPTSGQILIDGRPVELNSPQQAQDLGIAVVHQHFNLVPQLSVAENLFLSQALPRRIGLFVNWNVIGQRARKLLERVGLKIDPWTEVSKLRPDESAMVAIAKAIGSDARIIILDEPTSALLPAEVSILFGHMRRLATEGHSFLYVSHRLTEVFEIADRVTVLRDGRRAGAWTREEMSRKAIIKAIVGGDKPWIEGTDVGRIAYGEPVFVAAALAGGRVRDLSFELRAGEVLGFAGLPGSGAEEALVMPRPRASRSYRRTGTRRVCSPAQAYGKTSRFPISTALSPIRSPDLSVGVGSAQRVRKLRPSWRSRCPASSPRSTR